VRGIERRKEARRFTTHGQPIGETGRDNRKGKRTQGDGMIMSIYQYPSPNVALYLLTVKTVFFDI
jgi:hypothetical protein